MNRLATKRKRITRRVTRTRHAVKPKTPKPRLVINRSNRYLDVQIIDDLTGKTLCAASTNEKDFGKKGKNKESAAALGELIASRASDKGVKQVVLDRRGNLYHGKIAAFAEAAREKGLEF